MNVKAPNELFSLKNQTAVITGASSGLGVAFARGLAAAGANIILAARRSQPLKQLSLELAKTGIGVQSVTCDVTREQDVDNMVDVAMECFGRLDILINNAGVATVHPAEDEPYEEFRRVMETNVNAQFLCAQRCGRIMLEAGKGSIVNIASMMGLVGIGVIPQAAYNTSKGAMINMTRELAAQWSKKGVRVNALGPGYFPSEMTTEMFDNEKSQNFIERRTLLKRAGRPEELIGPLLLLASEAGSYITGQTLIVDGGWTAV
ncbi:Short-chain dehydrogenase/reductase SDR [Desulfatibacillum aliphaticivorans]|uniref:Short-chain dehydrogenase/reductase SDR n=1 Tax=Desulfatibacillum aliphaticivorans TaxID=218208 RepID=B8F8T6_DESAL|nr:glucose 1-dehydrogenase [Desulfatibacillum aliphaticivorans]ACL01968.1 Short-chain dehydrogenase/reductase SDR [Desulfatibacillum aliphaticivorans]